MKGRVKLIIFLSFAAVLIFSSVNIAFADEGADELYENISSILDNLDLSALDEYLAAHGDSLLMNFGDNAGEIINYLVSGNLGINYSGYAGELLSVLFSDVVSLLPSFAQIVALSIVCAIVKGAEDGIISSGTAKVVRIVCYALIIAVLASMLGGIISEATACINNLKVQMEIVTPILVTLTVLTGGGGASTIYQPAALFISGGAVEIVCGIIFPATIAIMIINFISKLAPDMSFSGTAKLIKSILKWVIGITLAVFSLFITAQSASASLFDGIFFKATKYLVGNSVPIVGNFLSAGVDMVVAAGSVVRNSVGLVGIVLMVAEIAPPIILLAAFSLILKLAGAIAQPIGEGTLFSLFSDAASDIEYIIAGVCTVAFMYALVVMLVINSAGNFI